MVALADEERFQPGRLRRSLSLPPSLPPFLSLSPSLPLSLSPSLPLSCTRGHSPSLARSGIWSKASSLLSLLSYSLNKHHAPTYTQSDLAATPSRVCYTFSKQGLANIPIIGPIYHSDLPRRAVEERACVHAKAVTVLELWIWHHKPSHNPKVSRLISYRADGVPPSRLGQHEGHILAHEVNIVSR